ncbi:uncharacterized protein LOC26534573 isoform X1 [Drosophila yakuba]|uniref:uncharacterized protein LOC26534573 isoform X1 n=1 Tax=Drosophila yakuba TaxID=7245 RepID=UPI001930831D|nr:uncharacterized protein LOC26534573 isoform X1 [Drosophila yakuba]
MSWKYGLIRDMSRTDYLITSSEFGVVMPDKFPKAKHHYLVLPREDIPSIFHLNRTHLPLLRELYNLAQNAVKIRGVTWEDFQVGFHAEPSLQRLHLHVISKDFVSPCMKTKKHWNAHNTELFVPYEKLCVHLERENCFSRLPKSLVNEMLSQPLICNQCKFAPESLLDLKAHLFYHWHSRKKEHEQKHIIDGISKMSFRNTPPKHIQAMTPPQLNQLNHRPLLLMYHGPRTFGDGHYFSPSQRKGYTRTPGNKGFRPPPPINAPPHYTKKTFAGERTVQNGQENGAIPRRIPKTDENKNQQVTQERIQQNLNSQQPNQDSNQQSSSNSQIAQQQSYNIQQKNTHEVNSKNIHDQIRQNTSESSTVQNQKAKQLNRKTLQPHPGLKVIQVNGENNNFKNDTNLNQQNENKNKSRGRRKKKKSAGIPQNKECIVSPPPND